VRPDPIPRPSQTSRQIAGASSPLRATESLEMTLNDPIRRFAVATILCLACAIPLHATPAGAWIRHIEQQAGLNLSRYEWAFNQCVATALASGLSGADFDTFLGACCGQVEQACYGECGSNLDCQGTCAEAGVTCEDGASVDFYGASVDTSIPRPVVSEINPSPRVDFCLDGDTGCGAPAAHMVCQRELGADYGALSFVADGVPASLEDPTWQLGRWYPRQPYGAGQGFELVLCDRLEGTAISFEDVADDPDLDGVTTSADNCPTVPNPFQRNRDGDLWGDACDPEPDVVRACSNGLDDDGDGISDAEDPGCTSHDDDAETDEALVCDNGLDDDGDGWIDSADVDCAGPTDASESAARCGDGVDDDGDGLIDLEDPGCTSPDDDSEFGDAWTTDFSGLPNKSCNYFSCSTWYWTDPDYRRLLGDVDGDGRDDIVGFRGSGVDVALAEEHAFGPREAWSDDMGVSDLRSRFSFDWGDELPPRFVSDVDGDGLADLVGISHDTVYVARSTGQGFAPREAWSAPGELGASRFVDGDAWGSQGEARMVDVDADGLDDVVIFAPEGVLVGLNLGDSFAPPALWTVEFGSGSDSPFYFSPRSRHFGDVDGDGLLDLVGFTSQDTWVAFSTGDGFEPAIVGRPEFAHAWGAVEHRFLADVDGDGDDDLVAFGSTHVRIGRGSSEGIGAEEYWLSHFGAWQRDFRNDMRIVEDLNGDGLADLLISDAQGVSAWHSKGDGLGERMVLGYGFTTGPNEYWSNHGRTPRSLSDVDGDGEKELVGFGQDAVIVAELGAAAEPLPAPVPEPGFGLSLVAGVTALLGLNIRRRD
jgi:hypothetical protein